MLWNAHNSQNNNEFNGNICVIFIVVITPLSRQRFATAVSDADHATSVGTFAIPPYVCMLP